MRLKSWLACAATSAVVATSAVLGPVSPGSASPPPASAKSLSPSAAVAKAHWRPNGAVRAIVVSRTRVFIAGDFTRLLNTVTQRRVNRVRVAAFNRHTGALVRTFHPRVNGPVEALTVFDGRLVLGGDFTLVNNKNRQHLAAVKLGSGRLSAWRAQVNGPVLALLTMRGHVYVGGNFNHVDSVTRSKLFAMDALGVLLPNWPNQGAGSTDGGVYSLAASANRRSVVVGGAFHTLVGNGRTYLGSIARDSGNVRRWQPVPVCLDACFVKDLAVSKTTVYAGITGPGGHATAYRRTDAGTKWSLHTSGDVNAVELSGRHLLIGGHFTRVAGHRHNMFAQLVASNGAVTRRRPATSGIVFPGVLDIDVHDGRARIGGAFANLGGQRRYAILAQ